MPVNKVRELVGRAVESATHADEKETAALYEAVAGKTLAQTLATFVRSEIDLYLCGFHAWRQQRS